jgi:hypothetical protein
MAAGGRSTLYASLVFGPWLARSGRAFALTDALRSVAAFLKMLRKDRQRAALNVERAAWRLGISHQEYRELETGERTPTFEISDLQRIPVASARSSRDFPYGRPGLGVGPVT